MYRQIADHYRAEITEGRLRVGDRIPAVRALTDEWDVAQGTVLKALEILKVEGYVEVIRGSAGGTFVSNAYEHTAADRMAAAMQGKIYPENERARIVSAEFVSAPAEVAEALGVEVGAQVIRRHRVTYRDDVPRSTSTSWFVGALADACPLLLVAERLPQGTPGYIREQTGVAVVSSSEQVAAGAADAAAAAELGVDVGSPVLLRRNWARADDGGVVEYGQSTSVQGRWLSYG